MAESEIKRSGSALKSRTPSGTDCQYDFKNIRNIFSPERVDEESELTGNLSDSQVCVRPCLRLDERRHSTGTKLSAISSIVQTVKNRTSAKAFALVKDQNKQTDQSDSETDAYHTPPATPKRIINKAKRLRKSKGPVHNSWQIGVNQFFKKSKSNPRAMEDQNSINDSVVQNEEQTEMNVDTEVNQAENAEIKSSTTNTEVKQHTEQDILRLAASAQEKIPDSEVPKFLDIRTVMKMFRELKQDSAAKPDDGWKEKIDRFIEQHPKDQQSRFEKVYDELKWAKKRERIMARTVQRMQDITMELATKIDNLEINNAKRCIVISGLWIEGKKDSQIRQVEHFLYTDVGVDAQVEDTYPISQTNPPARVVVLLNQKDKHMIMKKKKILKDMQFEHPVYINDYQPAALNERRKWEQEILSLNESLPTDEQKTIKFTAGKIVLDGEVQDQPVIPPGPEDILDLSEEELDHILRIKVLSGPKIEQDSSEFKAYTIAVSSHQEVQEAYSKVRWVHAAARHIVCAYYLPEESIFEQKGYCDDGEIGAGRKVMDLLVQNHIGSRAIFIVRYYGGTKLGTDRFQCYIQAAKGAIQQHPYNLVLKIEQSLPNPMDNNEHEETLMQTSSQPQPQPQPQLQPLLQRVTRSRPRGNSRGRGNPTNRSYSKVLSSSKRRGMGPYRPSSHHIRGTRMTTNYGAPRGVSRYSQMMNSYQTHKPHLKRRRYSSSVEGSPLQNQDSVNERFDLNNRSPRQHQEWSTNDGHLQELY